MTDAAADDAVDGFKEFGGSDNPAFNRSLFRAALATIANLSPDGDDRFTVAATSLAAFKPADEIEAMLSAQCIGLHQVSMACLRKSMIVGQPFEISSRLRKDAASLARGMVEMLDALDRRRGKGPQVVRVERVTIHDGGQAFVGIAAAATTISGKGEGGAGATHEISLVCCALSYNDALSR